METNELNQLIIDTYEVGQRILRMKNLIDMLNNPSTKAKYNEEVFSLLEDFNLMCDLLKKELEDYIKLEKEKNLPVNLSYRKILRDL